MDEVWSSLKDVGRELPILFKRCVGPGTFYMIELDHPSQFPPLLSLTLNEQLYNDNMEGSWVTAAQTNFLIQ